MQRGRAQSNKGLQGSSLFLRVYFRRNQCAKQHDRQMRLRSIAVPTAAVAACSHAGPLSFRFRKHLEMDSFRLVPVPSTPLSGARGPEISLLQRAESATR
jgi:hypothetical protein